MQKIRLIIFDLDGTLIDAYKAITNSFNFTMRKFSLPLEPAIVIRRAVGKGDLNLLKPYIKKDDLSEALKVFRKHHKAALIKEARLYPYAMKLLKYLKKKRYLLAVASNRPNRFSAIILNTLKIKKYFKYVLCSDQLKYPKPHPQHLKKIMRKFKVNPEQTVFVGDMTIDAKAGKSAGVKTYILTSGSSQKHEIKKLKPDKIIRGIRDLFRFL